MPKLNKGNFVLAPLIGSIVCGIPNPSEENYEDTYALPTDIFGKGHLFMLHAEGNSMIEAGVSPGDLLVSRQATPNCQCRKILASLSIKRIASTALSSH